MSTPYYGQPVNVGSFSNITGQGNTLVKTGEGVLYQVTFNKPTATSVLTIYDGTSSSGTKIATITVPASPQPVSLIYDAYFATGLYVNLATADSDITITYR